MPDELSAKDKRMKALMEKTLSNPDSVYFARYRRLHSLLPKDPRCTACMSPFIQPGDRFFTSFY